MTIVTRHIEPPIPIRGFDWEARFENDDEDGPIGHGPDEVSAIMDLMNNIEGEQE